MSTNEIKLVINTDFSDDVTGVHHESCIMQIMEYSKYVLELDCDPNKGSVPERNFPPLFQTNRREIMKNMRGYQG